MILHIINKSPFQHSAMQDALPLIHVDDCVILIDDGVYCASIPACATALHNTQASIFALAIDTEIRGILCDKRISAIDMDKFVELTFSAEKTISWY